ncbi:hypothetical protein LOC68_20160 [Blastopirellula sp. JC732]|uniref:Uncharacterized protein n=1 Tax=Blastopirellula sediminis TaxID=2894196 RepID=A0A9X1SID6_9BACT|nr:hypothetical protein [Blastopirellula sediminis]MCC9605985.1 hypothetical protein [Blastopirellula sediminis]MCC9630716.1 hypothetical protein [Blastopirellula sediminis]
MRSHLLIRPAAIFFSILVLSICSSSAHAQFFEQSTGENATLTYTFSLTPKSPQPPIMKYRLYPSYSEQVPGNAAPLYHRAILLISQHSAHLKSPLKYWQEIDEWRLTPLEELPIDEVETVVNSYSSSLQEASFAARREHCDWNLPIKEHGVDVFSVLLPEIQEMRTVARILALRIRLRLAQGRLDDAIADLQTGYAMARHVGNRDFIVNALVGIAIGSIMDEQLLTALSVDSTPNLYWSIVNQPTPLVDIRNAIDVERDNIVTVFPELKEAENNIGDQAYWDQKLQDVIARNQLYQSNPRQNELDLMNLAYRAAIFSQVERVKQELVDKFGYDKRAVETMPGSRAILLYSYRHFQRLRDQYIAPIGLPYHQAQQFYPADNQISRELTVGDPLKLAETLLPSLATFQNSAARQDRWYAMLLAVEAIRDYAAIHGELPESLDAVRLPIPKNPFDDQPFTYQRQADAQTNATLEGVSARLPLRFQITLRQP